MDGKIIEMSNLFGRTARTRLTQEDFVKFLIAQRRMEASLYVWLDLYSEIKSALLLGLPVEPGLRTVTIIRDRFAMPDWPEINFGRMEVR